MKQDNRFLQQVLDPERMMFCLRKV